MNWRQQPSGDHIPAERFKIVTVRVSPELYDRIIEAARDSRCKLGEYCLAAIVGKVDGEDEDA